MPKNNKDEARAKTKKMIKLTNSQYNEMCRIVLCGMQALHDDVGIPKGMYLTALKLAKMADTEMARRLYAWLNADKTRKRVIWVLNPVTGSFSKWNERRGERTEKIELRSGLACPSDPLKSPTGRDEKINKKGKTR